MKQLAVSANNCERHTEAFNFAQEIIFLKGLMTTKNDSHCHCHFLACLQICVRKNFNLEFVFYTRSWSAECLVSEVFCMIELQNRLHLDVCGVFSSRGGQQRQIIAGL